MKTLPTGREVEGLALTMAAILGADWAKLDDDRRRDFRLMANAALVRLRGRDSSIGDRVVDGAVAGAVEGLRKGARRLEALLELLPAPERHRERATAEPLLEELYKAATALEVVGRAVASEPADEEAV